MVDIWRCSREEWGRRLDRTGEKQGMAAQNSPEQEANMKFHSDRELVRDGQTAEVEEKKKEM